jgi:hypothetical protein
MEPRSIFNVNDIYEHTRTAEIVPEIEEISTTIQLESPSETEHPLTIVPPTRERRQNAGKRRANDVSICITKLYFYIILYFYQ